MGRENNRRYIFFKPKITQTKEKKIRDKSDRKIQCS